MACEQCEYQSLEKPIRSLWQVLGRMLQQLGKRLERWDQLAEQRRQLLEMDDRLLKDIGLSQADVERIAGRRNFWDDPLKTGEQIDQRYRGPGRY